MKKPQPLETLPETPSLSKVAEIVVTNYTKYHEQSEQLNSLQHWIIDQKEIFDGL